MQVNVLGPLKVQWQDRVATPTAPKIRQVLALLAMNANNVVRTDQLIEELWEDRPPRSAATTLQTYIYQLRKRYLLAGDGAGEAPSLETTSNGYVLTLEEDCVDVKRFARIAERGRAQFDAGDIETAAETLREALRLWRGPALYDVSIGPVLQAFSVWLEELGKNVLELRIDADMMLGMHAELVGELAALVAEDPTHEGFQSKLILALYRAGRRADALQAFQLAREALDRELGVDPSPKLQQLQRGILTADPALDLSEDAPRRRPRPAEPAVARPNHLPPDVQRFVGRATQLAAVEAVLTTRARQTSPVALVVGGPGSGKSTFCVHAAHRLREQFPDGQLHAQLTGENDEPVDPGAVLANFLWAIGVPEAEVPDTAAKRASLFRSLTADRRVLLVLDDVVDPEQVLPLLPTGEGCATLIAGRRRVFASFISSTLVMLPFGRQDGLRLMAPLVGDDRVELEERAAGELVELCDGIPLALQAAGSTLALRPHWAVDRLVRMLGSGHGDGHGEQMRRSVRRAYALLPERTQELFRLIGALDQPVSAGRIAVELGLDETAAELMLEDLVQFQLAEVEIGTSPAEAGLFRYHLTRPIRDAARSFPGDARVLPGESPSLKAVR